MARPFKYAEVPNLAVGEHVILETPESLASLMKRCDAHAKRAGKSFSYIQVGEGRIQVARQPVAGVA